MRPKAKIIVLIAPDGTPTVEVQGCPGASCQALTRQLEADLGQTLTDERTPEYYQRAPAQDHVRLDQS